MEYRFCDNSLGTKDYIRLFAAAGWGEIPEEMAGMVDRALENSWATFTVECDEGVVAMARLLGDGAMSFFLKDLAVVPQMQGKGLGKKLLKHIEEYIASQLEPGWMGYLQLVSSKGKEGFYEKCGYRAHPNEHSGPAMSKWISKR